MALVSSDIELIPYGTYYGLVTVYAKDGSIERRFRVTKKQIDEFHADPKNPDPTILGCTPEEWHAPPLGEGRAQLDGKSVDVGQAILKPDGETLLIKYKEETINDVINEYLMKLTPPDWDVQLGVVRVSDVAKAILDDAILV